MKKQLLFFLLIMFSSWSNAECLTDEEAKYSEYKVKEIIENSRKCVSDEECIILSLGCPFGCSSAVNKKREELVVGMAKDFRDSICNQCQYKCGAVGEVACHDNICRTKAQYEFDLLHNK